MTIVDKLEDIFYIKQKIYNAIAHTGVDIHKNSVFGDYPGYVRSIPTTTFDTVSVKHQNFNMKTTYYNADTAQVWTGGTVNFGGNLYDLDPSMIADGKEVLGITGETATIADNDYYILDDDFADHRDRIEYIRNKSGIFNSSEYNSDYYEGMFISDITSTYITYVFCLRNFDITEFTGSANVKYFKYKNAITVKYNPKDGTYSASYDIDRENENMYSRNRISYSSRYLYYGHFDSGHPYMPMQIYPKPFEVTLDLKNYLLPETTKLRFEYRGNGMLVHMCINIDDDEYCFNWDGQNASNEWHRCSISLSEIPNLLDKTSVRLILVGHITGLHNAENEELDGGGFVQGLFSLAEKTVNPLPHEMRDCRYLFKNSNIKVVNSNLMSYCYNTIETITGMFRSCPKLTTNVSTLFDKCSKLKNLDYT